MLSLQSFPREGRVVGPCWEKLKPQGPKGTQTPQQSHPLSPLHEPLLWRAKRDPKAYMLSLQSFPREGRVVGLCWAQLKSQGPKG